MPKIKNIVKNEKKWAENFHITLKISNFAVRN